jgi:hypothetical protein
MGLASLLSTARDPWGAGNILEVLSGDDSVGVAEAILTTCFCRRLRQGGKEVGVYHKLIPKD